MPFGPCARYVMAVSGGNVGADCIRPSIKRADAISPYNASDLVSIQMGRTRPYNFNDLPSAL